MQPVRTLLCALTLTACQIEDPVAPPDDDTAPPQGICPAAEWQGLLGEPAAAVAAIPDPKRIIGPNDAVTMDYRPDRTNVDLNDAGRIIRIRCG